MNPDFSNTATAFAHLSDKKLKQALFLFSFITKPFWVKSGKILLSIAKKLGIPYGWAVRNNIFSHFCGGENIEQCKPAIAKLASLGCYSILDYSAEGLNGEENFDAVCSEIKKTIEFSKESKHIGFGVFKFTGICDFALLEKISRNEPLNETEQQQWNNALLRAESIFKLAHSYQLPVFVDAEETWIQPAIDRMIEPLMVQLNRQTALVYTTIQMYRSNSLDLLKHLIDNARRSGFIAGVKLVRGAYMEKERIRAAKLGYPSPIHVDKNATDSAFNEAVTLCIHNIDHIHCCIATHNEDSCKHGISLMKQVGIKPGDKRVCFAQLYGMSDHITFNLAATGYYVAKYLPYGPIEKVMPYLVRRAEENSSVRGQSNREIDNLKRELQRRKGTKLKQRI